ncbi:hypothetical protein L1987_85637 [Smallanthus sonchifolius]|uniref:Uncharacterized protein n=1 Tax=Smallanthus sonchifolius TaxID=185202 RepID=A0ACB8XY54_9ASTR|nr:hypothetical protein L1987_85637 [Smallanthus sonchifolius]
MREGIKLHLKEVGVLNDISGDQIEKMQKKQRDMIINTVDEKDRMPQKEGANLRMCWLYAGTNYGRIVEPLCIAEYYKKGNKDNIGHRPNHYILLEKWSNDPKSSEEKRNKASSFTEDSCFSVHVEEALISLREWTV